MLKLLDTVFKLVQVDEFVNVGTGTLRIGKYDVFLAMARGQHDDGE
jgi:hypothetical protein